VETVQTIQIRDLVAMVSQDTPKYQKSQRSRPEVVGCKIMDPRVDEEDARNIVSHGPTVRNMKTRRQERGSALIHG